MAMMKFSNQSLLLIISSSVLLSACNDKNDATNVVQDLSPSCTEAAQMDVLPDASSLDVTTMTACYQVTFDANWQEPNFTNIPGGAHFTQLAGASTVDGAELWATGELASDGFEILAETGSTSSFVSELNTAQANNLVANVFTASGTSATSSSTFVVEVSRTYPNLTWASMLAPSPDWFVGQSEYDLLNDQAEWLDEITLDLPVYDAGTETGSTFSLGGADTNPAELIERLNETVSGSDTFVNRLVDGNAIATIRYRRIQ